LATNFVRHPAEQKWKLCPACSAWWGVFAGSTVIPQTGSKAEALPLGVELEQS
jgi:hypothetical protein